MPPTVAEPKKKSRFRQLHFNKGRMHAQHTMRHVHPPTSLLYFSSRVRLSFLRQNPPGDSFFTILRTPAQLLRLRNVMSTDCARSRGRPFLLYPTLSHARRNTHSFSSPRANISLPRCLPRERTSDAFAGVVKGQLSLRHTYLRRSDAPIRTVRRGRKKIALLTFLRAEMIVSHSRSPSRRRATPTSAPCPQAWLLFFAILQ